MRGRLFVGTGVVGVALIVVPVVARADQEFPNTDDFVSASPGDYRALVGGYANTGIRFGTPDGLHCSMSVSLKGSGGGTASCWGALPGAPPDGANMVYVDSDRGSSFVRADLAAMERTWVLDPAHPGAGRTAFTRPISTQSHTGCCPPVAAFAIPAAVNSIRSVLSTMQG